MAYNRKWKPSKAAVQKWLETKDETETNFKNEIGKIQKETDIIIFINKNCNSVYFEKNGEKYRVSTHLQIDKGSLNFSEDHIIKKSYVTNSRDNIIKKVREILKGE